ncbi:MAG: diadenylate cyclase CdaA [Rikenellaceae bacterium]
MDIFALTLLDVIDIMLVAIVFYQLYMLIRGTAAIYIFVTISAIYLLWVVTKTLGMELISNLLGEVIGVGLIALVVVFQQEIRQFLLFVGNKYFSIFSNRFKSQTEDVAYIDEIVTSVVNMSDSLTGALIVFTRKNGLNSVVTSGDIIDAHTSNRLIENIFYKNSPLHDGAMVITGGRIKAARCLLPTSERSDIPASMGMRHRAAIGISEHTDAVVVVVSEQTGRISYIESGVISPSLNALMLRERLTKALT